jgi:glycosyltransferase involved in cell wall biosynthesis
MNILHLTHTDINSDSRILKEMLSIANSNNTYNVQGIGIERNEDRNSNTTENITIHSLKLRSRNWKKLPNILRHILILIEFYIKLFSFSKKLKPNIIHCHDVMVLPIGVLVKIFYKTKLIYDAHELESQKNGITPIESKIVYFVEKISWKCINNLIVVSPSIVKWYNREIGKKSTEIIMNAPFVAKNNIDEESDYLRKLYNIPKSSKIFIYIGGFMKGRGIEILMNIFKKEDINSHIVFLGYGELRDKMIQESDKYVKIHVHDAVPHEKVIPIAKSADIGLCFIQNISLSDYYCLPNKLFEYAFAEIPMLASNFPDIIEVVDKFNLGKYSSLEIEDIFNTIKEFEEMEELPKIKSENLYELSWQKQEEKLIKLYQKLIAEK